MTGIDATYSQRTDSRALSAWYGLTGPGIEARDSTASWRRHYSMTRRQIARIVGVEPPDPPKVDRMSAAWEASGRNVHG